MTTPPIPPPDLEEHETELWGQNVCDDYWRQAKMREYGAACAAQERDRCAAIVAQGGAYRSSAQELGDWAFPEEAIRTGLTP